MAYEMVMPYHLHMPSYFLETFTEYPSLGLLHRLIFHFRRLIHFLLYMNDVIIPISLISKGYIVLQNTQRIVQSIRNPEFSS